MYNTSFDGWDHDILNHPLFLGISQTFLVSSHHCYPWVLRIQIARRDRQPQGLRWLYLSSARSQEVYNDELPLCYSVRREVLKRAAKEGKGTLSKKTSVTSNNKDEAPQNTYSVKQVTPPRADSTCRQPNKQLWPEEVSAKITCKWTKSRASPGEVGVKCLGGHHGGGAAHLCLHKWAGIHWTGQEGNKCKQRKELVQDGKVYSRTLSEGREEEEEDGVSLGRQAGVVSGLTPMPWVVPRGTYLLLVPGSSSEENTKSEEFPEWLFGIHGGSLTTPEFLLTVWLRMWAAQGPCDWKIGR